MLVTVLFLGLVVRGGGGRVLRGRDTAEAGGQAVNSGGMCSAINSASHSGGSLVAPLGQ